MMSNHSPSAHGVRICGVIYACFSALARTRCIESSLSLSPFVFLLLMFQYSAPAWAASFDCAKATSAVERRICNDAELSMLDSELADIYSEAQKYAEDNVALKLEQLEWLRKRDRCDDNACIRLAYQSRVVELKSSRNESKLKSQRYRLVVGKGVSICETFLNHLNALPPNDPPMVCDIRQNSAYNALTSDEWDITQPEWEELNVQENLRLIYEAEMELPPYYRYQYKYRPALFQFPDFEAWKQNFNERITTATNEPRVFRAKFVVSDSIGVKTIIGYVPESYQCNYGVECSRFVRICGVNTFVLNDGDDKTLHVIQGSFGSNRRQNILRYRGKTYFAWGTKSKPDKWVLFLSSLKLMEPIRFGEYVSELQCKYEFNI